MRKTSRRQTAHATSRNEARRQGSMRLVRTIALGALATVAALYWLGDQYGIDHEIMLEYVGTALLFTGSLAVLGVGGALVLGLIKKLLRR